jgi:hypothetical protein
MDQHGLGNIKCAIAGTCRSFDPQHTERYLASYEWRFSRRFDLDKNVERLARIAAQAAPAPFLDDNRNIFLAQTGTPAGCARYGGTGPGKSNIAIGLARNIIRLVGRRASSTPSILPTNSRSR